MKSDGDISGIENHLEFQHDRQFCLVLTDSLGMPREGVDYDETWIHHLRRKLDGIEVIDHPTRAGTTDILRDYDSLERYDPTLVITQFGIVDCAPRYSNAIERQLFDWLPKRITLPYMNAMRKVRKRRPRRAYLSTSEFEANLRDYYERAIETETEIVSIIIAPPTTEFIEKSSHIESQINTYNEIYRRVATDYNHVHLLDPYTSIDDLDSIMIDHEHPNTKGHRLITESIIGLLYELS